MTHPAPLPPNESERLARLRALGVLDSQPEALFDTLTRAASEVCGTPIALLSLVDVQRQWFKAAYGLAGIPETPRDISFCAHTILQPEIMEVPDATLDARFAQNPFVTGDSHVRFYSGAPITLTDGTCMGSLCVIDQKPRELTQSQRNILEQLARAAAQALEARERSVTALLEVERAHARIERLYHATPAMLHSINGQGLLISVSDVWLKTMGYRRDEVLGRPSTDFLTPESAKRARECILPQFFRDGAVQDIEYQMRCRDGRILDVLMSAILERASDGAPLQSLAVTRDITRRAVAERQLAESEGRYRELVNQQTEMVSTATPEGLLTYANPAYAAIFQSTPDALVGRNLLDFVVPAQREAVAHHLKEVCTSRMAGRGENDILLADGSRRWISWSNKPMFDSHGRVTAIHSVGRDITARKAAEHALRDSEAALERTGAIAGVGGWELDLRTNCLTWSAQTRRLHEVDPNFQPTLEKALAFFEPQARSAVEKAVRNAVEQGRSWDIELPLVSAKGRPFWARVVGAAEFADGRVVRLVGALQDITERRRMELELQENRELLQVTLDSIAEAVITTDVAGRVKWLNPVAERLTGWTKEQGRGKALPEVFSIVDEDGRSRLPDPIRACLEDPTDGSDPKKATLTHRLGGSLDIEMNVSPIKSPVGFLWGAVLVFRDISEQRRLARELRYRATHDFLTGLPNRAEFEVKLAKLMESAQTQKAHHVLMYIDLDYFKQVNDRCGHAEGDRLLREVSALLQLRLRQNDLVGRLGGDEFGILLEKCEPEQGLQVAQRICDQLAALVFEVDGFRAVIGASIGLVPLDDRWKTMAEATVAADAACYEAKKKGRGQVFANLAIPTSTTTEDGVQAGRPVLQTRQ